MRWLADEGGAVYRMLRRMYFRLCRPEYVRRQLARRQGVCGRHGCCDLTAMSRWKNLSWHKCLDRDERTCCRRWPDLPEYCRWYPFDEQDKIPQTRDYCNFHWPPG